MSTLYNFTRLAPVPTATSLIDIVLSKTQRKTPTVVHPGYNITRIRNFYARKVKFAQEAFEEKVNGIVQGFPILDVSIEWRNGWGVGNETSSAEN